MVDTHSDARERITSIINEYLVVLQRKPVDALKGLGELARAMDRLGYQHHWGRHLHELRVYLHALAAW